jgi:hypothetical protein
MRKSALAILLCILVSPARATTYYIATAAGGGSDSNDGMSESTPWLTPNHAVNCGDVIIAAASTSYSAANFTTGKWGNVTCPSGNNIAWLKCVTFDGCKIFTNSTQGMWVDKSYWGVQGWEVTVRSFMYGACFEANPNFIIPIEIHHIIFANNIANGCLEAGFASSNEGATASVDYLVIVGNIAFNTAQGNGVCGSGISIYQPISSDTLPGTHIFIAGNFSYENFDPNPCAGGISSDGEGIILDTLDGSQGGLPSPYAQQIAVENNISFLNGGRGIQENDNTSAKVFIEHNTIYGNNGDTNQGLTECGDLHLRIFSLTETSYNLVATNSATGCGASLLYAMALINGDGTDQVHNNFAYGINGQNAFIYSSSTFANGPNNSLGTNPSLSNPVNPGAPSCGSALSVPNCMAAVIANFTPTTATAVGYGYQIPSTAQTYDPLFPRWLCNVNLPAGLVTMGCLAQSSLPASPTITSLTVQ